MAQTGALAPLRMPYQDILVGDLAPSRPPRGAADAHPGRPGIGYFAETTGRVVARFV
jgi:hypothetical protein